MLLEICMLERLWHLIGKLSVEICKKECIVVDQEWMPALLIEFNNSMHNIKPPLRSLVLRNSTNNFTTAILWKTIIKLMIDMELMESLQIGWD